MQIIHGLYELILLSNKMGVATKQEKGINHDLNYPVKFFYIPVRCKCALVSLFMTYKRRHNLCMNLTSLYRESLDCVS